jgi:glycosyltransferase involved in cell wall biosynthesis
LKVPVSVIIAAKNEESRLAACLAALTDFDEIIVVDSGSTDRTCEIAQRHDAEVVQFQWDGRYPKKRQWCLDYLQTKHDWIFFVDADEVLTSVLVDEIYALPFNHAGYFVKGRYIWNGQSLDHGIKNNKIVLFDRRKFEFPTVNDLDIPGMGEMEGHYQPVLKAAYRHEKIGQLKTELNHDAAHTEEQWLTRHQRYAAWERGMNARKAWPQDPMRWRQVLKTVFRAMPARGTIAFIHCYMWKGGILDGAAGLDFARKRAAYYKMISSCNRQSRSISSRTAS